MTEAPRRDLRRVPRLFAMGLIATRFLLAQEASDAELRFEAGAEGSLSAGWGGGPQETLHYDEVVKHSGRASARIERDDGSPQEFSTFTKRIPIDFSGRTIELRAYLRTRNVADSAGLWLRLDGQSGSVGFGNLGDKAPSGDTEWQQYEVTLRLDPGARDVFFGFLLSGPGTAWGDDFELSVDGKPYWEAPKVERELTVLDTDVEFVSGSGVAQQELTETQIENVAVLGEMWGFLKYHHPRIAKGELHWDFELFRVLPEVLEATHAERRNQALLEWVNELGEPPDCSPCAATPEDLHLPPEHDWIGERELGSDLVTYLSSVRERRSAGGRHFYLSLVRGVGNPKFENELAYRSLQTPDLGYRLLSLFRLWSIIEYWFPYRDLLDEDWHATLREFVPRLAAATTRDAYELEMMALIARVKDTHANLWSSLQNRPPKGDCELPVDLRFVEEMAVVSSLRGKPPEQLRRGDVIRSLDDERVRDLVKRWSPYYAASNAPTRLRDIARSMTRGACGPAKLGIERGGETLELSAERITIEARAMTHDRAGETFQLLSEDVAYLKLSSIKNADLAGYFERAAKTKGLVVDIRNYPSDFVVFNLTGRLLEESTEFARFTAGDLANPGAFRWTPSLRVGPIEPGYRGKVAVLIDEISQSNAEYTTMALRAAPRTVVIGSTTAGADGNVSPIPLPGGLRTMISGIGVFYPDKTPTQRIGIVPDIEALPTIEGIRAGRDELLEVAIQHILGPDASEDEIRRMAARP